MAEKVPLVAHWCHSLKANHGCAKRCYCVLNDVHLWSFQQWVASVDIFPNEDADANVVLAATESWTEQEKEVSTENLYKLCVCVH